MLSSAPVLGEGPATVRQFAGFEARTGPAPGANGQMYRAFWK